MQHRFEYYFEYFFELFVKNNEFRVNTKKKKRQIEQFGTAKNEYAPLLSEAPVCKFDVRKMQIAGCKLKSHNHLLSRWLAQPYKGIVLAGLKAHRIFCHLQICPTNRKCGAFFKIYLLDFTNAQSGNILNL